MSRTTSGPNRFTKRFSLAAALTMGAGLAMGAGCTFEPPGSVLAPASRTDAGADPAADAGALESMTVSFTTVETPGAATPNFAPRNLVATWIEDDNGAFVQTIDRQESLNYAKYLLGWAAMSGGAAADLDGVSGATRLDHALPVSATWSIPADLADGIYTIRIETADGNAVTPDQNVLGTFTFEKNGTASVGTPLPIDGYSNINIDYSGRP